MASLLAPKEKKNYANQPVTLLVFSVLPFDQTIGNSKFEFKQLHTAMSQIFAAWKRLIEMQIPIL